MTRINIVNRTSFNADSVLVDRVVEYVSLPTGTIDLLFHNSQLPADEHAYCIASRLHKFVPDYKCLCRDLRDDWDCCIVLSQRAGRYQETFPAYFTYLIAHELCHAKIFLADLSLHVLCSLVHDFIREASNNSVVLSHLVPHERACDAVGLHVASQIHSWETVQQEIECLIQSPEHKDQERLVAMLSMDRSDCIGTLREDIIAFALPFKSQLIDLWKRDYDTYKDKSLASLVKDQEYEPLFKNA